MYVDLFKAIQKKKSVTEIHLGGLILQSLHGIHCSTPILSHFPFIVTKEPLNYQGEK